mgnify:CR=1 FL=1
MCLPKKIIVRKTLWIVLLLPTVSIGQGYSSSGSNWSGGWGFQSSTSNSVMVQRAQAIWNMENYQKPQAAQTTVNTDTQYFVTNDNRSAYQEFITGEGDLGDVDINFNGDEIGQNTNSIGAMNTGETNIEVNGSDNSITALNEADSDGCVDGHIDLAEAVVSNIESVDPISASISLPSHSTDC